VCGNASGSVWQCEQQYAAVRRVRQCVTVRAAMCGSARQCGSVCAAVRHCAALQAVVCGSARGSSVRHCERQCAAVQQCVRQCAAVCGSMCGVCGSARGSVCLFVFINYICVKIH
jgi:hypothetical protein